MAKEIGSRREYIDQVWADANADWQRRIRYFQNWGWVDNPPMALMQLRLTLFNYIGIIAWKGINNADFSEWEGSRLRDLMAAQGFEYRSIGVEGGVDVLFVKEVNGDSILIPHENLPLAILMAQYNAAISAVRTHYRLVDKGLAK